MRRLHRSDSVATRRPRIAGIAVALLAATAALGGCTSPRNTLGTTTSPCFRALAAATNAVHGEGHFNGVRSTTLGAIASAFERAKPSVVDVTVPVASPHTRVCVVAFRGNFETAKIASGWAVDAKRGTLAVVIVRLRDTKVLDTLVVAKPPLSFGRVFPPLR